MLMERTQVKDSRSTRPPLLRTPKEARRRPTAAHIQPPVLSRPRTLSASARTGSAEVQKSKRLDFGPGEVRVTALASVSMAGEDNSVPKENNQDAYVAVKGFCGSDRAHLFAIFDGHGEDGHLLTAYLREKIPQVLEPAVVEVLAGRSSIEELRQQLRALFPAVHMQMCQDLPLDSDVSGSTAVVALIVEGLLLCGSVGDSRALLGSKGSPWRLLPLTRDHRPGSPRENARISERGGRVEPNYDENHEPLGSPRVWVPGQSLPGLAMSRSLGDALVHRYGVTPEADIVVRQLRPWDRILLLASDGIWTYLSNEEALQMAERNYHKRKAADTCEQLYKEAVRRWKLNSSRVDDITVVTVFLN